MRTKEITPALTAKYGWEAFLNKCKKAISTFTSTCLAPFQYPTDVKANIDQLQAWR